MDEKAIDDDDDNDDDDEEEEDVFGKDAVAAAVNDVAIRGCPWDSSPRNTWSSTIIALQLLPSEYFCDTWQ